MMNAKELVRELELLPHPEGGFYKETFRSAESFADAGEEFPAGRSYSTAIYYLLEQGDFSAFHRIRSDECWHFYAGDCLHIHILHTTGNYELVKLGSSVSKGEVFQFVVPAGAWFASEPAPGSAFSFTGCTVSPGFDFKDFEMAKVEELLEVYPGEAELVKRLCR
jgi:uncharacterized protein